ncbi:hypothetical protein N0V85_005295 [Neurospora sp. IMI 360204]|nr:hypothetical protein N0V85_005295 [Neurospora sp. IMI 360204]
MENSVDNSVTNNIIWHLTRLLTGRVRHLALVALVSVPAWALIYPEDLAWPFHSIHRPYRQALQLVRYLTVFGLTTAKKQEFAERPEMPRRGINAAIVQWREGDHTTTTPAATKGLTTSDKLAIAFGVVAAVGVA